AGEPEGVDGKKITKSAIKERWCHPAHQQKFIKRIKRAVFGRIWDWQRQIIITLGAVEAGERVRIAPVENGVGQSLAKLGVEAKISKGLAQRGLISLVEVDLAALVVHSYPVATGAKFLALPASIPPHPDVQLFFLLLLLLHTAERARLIQHGEAALLSAPELIKCAVQTGHGEIIGYYLFLVGVRRQPLDAHGVGHLRGNDHEQGQCPDHDDED